MDWVNDIFDSAKRQAEERSAASKDAARRQALWDERRDDFWNDLVSAVDKTVDKIKDKAAPPEALSVEKGPKQYLVKWSGRPNASVRLSLDDSEHRLVAQIATPDPQEKAWDIGLDGSPKWLNGYGHEQIARAVLETFAAAVASSASAA